MLCSLAQQVSEGLPLVRQRLAQAGCSMAFCRGLSRAGLALSEPRLSQQACSWRLQATAHLSPALSLLLQLPQHSSHASCSPFLFILHSLITQGFSFLRVPLEHTGEGSAGLGRFIPRLVDTNTEQDPGDPSSSEDPPRPFLYPLSSRLPWAGPCRPRSP